LRAEDGQYDSPDSLVVCRHPFRMHRFNAGY
jgi:hypothetical protein